VWLVLGSLNIKMMCCTVSFREQLFLQFHVRDFKYAMTFLVHKTATRATDRGRQLGHFALGQQLVRGPRWRTLMYQNRSKYSNRTVILIQQSGRCSVTRINCWNRVSNIISVKGIRYVLVLWISLLKNTFIA